MLGIKSISTTESVNLQDVFREIANTFEEYKEELANDRKVASESIVVNELARLKDAIADGDLRENSAYEDALKDLAIKNGEIAGYARKIEKATIVPNLTARNMRSIGGSTYSVVGYNSIGQVMLYSVVRLRDLTDNVDYLLMLFPEGITKLQYGMLGCDTKIGSLLLNKSKGDIITILHKITGQPFQYEIVDLY